MSLCGDILYIQIKNWYVKFGATGSLNDACKFYNNDVEFSHLVYFFYFCMHIPHYCNLKVQMSIYY